MIDWSSTAIYKKRYRRQSIVTTTCRQQAKGNFLCAIICKKKTESAVNGDLGWQLVKTLPIFLLNKFSSVSSNRLPWQTHSHIVCICKILFHSEFSNVSSNCPPEEMHSRIGCIWLPFFLQNEFSYVSSNCSPEQMHSRVCCICKTILQSEFSNVSSICSRQHMHNHIGCIGFDFSPKWVFICALKLPA